MGSRPLTEAQPAAPIIHRRVPIGHYKTCKQCNEEKPIEDFSPNERRKLKSGEYKNYLSSYCKPCRAVFGTASREKYPHHWITNRYRVSKEEALHWYQKSMGECEICGKAWVEGDPKFCIDHDHTSGEIRGILCKPCNHLLGHSYDNPSILESARFYLLRKAG